MRRFARISKLKLILILRKTADMQIRPVDVFDTLAPADFSNYYDPEHHKVNEQALPALKRARDWK